MASTAGRVTRGVMGGAVITLALIGGGWWLLLALPGAAMVATGFLNYCPAGLALTGSGKSEDILAHIATYDGLLSTSTKG